MDGPMPPVRPSEDPQRQEVILLYFERKDGGSETWLVRYERGPMGSCSARPSTARAAGPGTTGC